MLLAGVLEEGLVQPEPAGQGTVVLTRRGRLLADAVVRAFSRRCVEMMDDAELHVVHHFSPYFRNRWDKG